MIRWISYRNGLTSILRDPQHAAQIIEAVDSIRKAKNSVRQIRLEIRVVDGNGIIDFSVIKRCFFDINIGFVLKKFQHHVYPLVVFFVSYHIVLPPYE